MSTSGGAPQTESISAVPEEYLALPLSRLRWFASPGFLFQAGTMIGALGFFAAQKHMRSVWWLCVVTGFLYTILGALIAFPPARSVTEVREPPSPWISSFLAHHVALHLIADVAFYGLLINATLQLFPGTTGSWFGILFVGPALVLVNRTYLVNGTLVAIKQCLAKRFRIVAFRRFSDAAATPMRQLVLPVLGAYGMNFIVYDDSQERARAGSNWDSETIISDIQATIRTSDLQWKQRVITELQHADLAVFYWSEVATENMWWEYTEALKYLPKDRVIFLMSPDLTSAHVRPNKYGLMLTLAGDAGEYSRFARDFYLYMRRLRSGQRPA